MKKMKEMKNNIGQKVKAYFEFYNEAEHEAYQSILANAENDVQAGFLMSALMFNQYRLG